jgi:fused signal recognition particle receptor
MFEFFKKRAEEGIAQVQNIATKTIDGKFIEALKDSSDYIEARRKIDLENLKRLSDGLSKSRDKILNGITSIFGDSGLDVKERLEKLEELLLQSDIGAATSFSIINDLREYAKSNSLEADDILPVLRARLIDSLTLPQNTNNLMKMESKPKVIFVIGANGMGKTTTIGKLAWRLSKELNVSVLLGACDTFRAAAVEQLNEWAIRSNVTIENLSMVNGVGVLFLWCPEPSKEPKMKTSI